MWRENTSEDAGAADDYPLISDSSHFSTSECVFLASIQRKRPCGLKFAVKEVQESRSKTVLQTAGGHSGVITTLIM